MIILTLRTDKPEAEIGLYRDDEQIAYVVWQAHRQLAETIHYKIEELLRSNGLALTDIRGIVFYKGPGSFTGLRIGASVMSSLAYSFAVPIVGAAGDEWLQEGVSMLAQGENQRVVELEYGMPVHITQQKK